MRSYRLGYPKRALNDHYLRDYFNSTVYFDGVEKRNRHVCVDRSLWRSEPIKCLSFHPLYKKDERRLLFLSRIPFHLPETLKHLASLRIRFTHWFIHSIVKHFTITTRDAKAPPLPKTPRSDKVYHDSIGTRMAKTQNQSHPSFSQNPKQGLVTSNFWRD